MLNLLRMNLYRMVHTRSLAILILTAMLFAGFSTYMASLDTENLIEIQDEEANAQDIPMQSDGDNPQETDQTVFGIYVNVPEMENGRPAAFIKYFCADISSHIIMVFLVIGAALFFSAEFKSGFVKNIAGQTRGRWQLYLSKLITFACYQLVLILAYGMAQYCMLKIYFGGKLMFGIEEFNAALLLFLLVQFLLHLAFASGIAMLTEVLRSSAFSITFGILSCFGFGQIIAGWIQKLADYDISPYYLTSNMAALSLEMHSKTVQSAFWAGIIYLVVYTLFSCIYLTKKDVV